MCLDDSQMMQAYAAGDTAAFESLYTKYKTKLYQYLLNSCESEATAGELFQDIWLKVIKSRASYQSHSPFNAWLFSIARNRLIDYYRQQGRALRADSINDESPENTISLASPTLNPEQIASLSERRDMLQNTLSALTEVQREAILLRHIAGMSTAEIAELVGVGTETVKSRLRYAAIKLRSLLEKKI